MEYINDNLSAVISLYCKNEVEKVKNDKRFIELNNLAKKHNLFVNIDYGTEKDNKKSKNQYLSISIHDKYGEMVELFFDDGFLSASTPLVLADRKDRYKFFNWNTPEFIDDIHWMIDQIKKKYELF